jgi:hypothetical protein
MSNYSLPGNPNETLTREQAVEYMVDCCLNVEETEWASASVRLVGMGRKTKNDAIKDIQEVAMLSFVKVDGAMLEEVYQTVEDNLL